MAFQIADSGTEIVLKKILKDEYGNVADLADLAKGNMTCDDSSGKAILSESGKSYNIIAKKSDGSEITSCSSIDKIDKIKSIGTYSNTSRAVEVKVCDAKQWKEEIFPACDNDTMILDFLVYNNKLYASTGDLANLSLGDPGACSSSNGRIYKFDGTNWTQIYQDTGAPNIFAIEVFNGKLYGASGNCGKIIEITDSNSNGEFDSGDVTSLPANLGSINTFTDLQVYNGELWAGYGCCNISRKVLWHYNGTGNFQEATFGPSYSSFGATLGASNIGGTNYLYLGENGKIWQCNSSLCSIVSSLPAINGSQLDVSSFLEYSGKFFAAAGNQGGSVGQMYYTTNGTAWNYFNNFVNGTAPGTPGTHDPWGMLYGMGIYNDGTGDKLYAGAGWYRRYNDLSTLEYDGGRLYKYDGTNWTMDVNNFQNNARIYDLQYYGITKKFYAGTEQNTNSTDILFKTPACD